MNIVDSQAVSYVLYESTIPMIIGLLVTFKKYKNIESVEKAPLNPE